MSHSPHDPRTSGERAARRPRYSGTHPRAFDQRYKERDPQRYPEMQTHVREQGRTPAGTHVPILTTELLACVDPRPGDVVVDATLGYGGHARAMLERIGQAGWLIGLDLDAAEARRTAERLGAAFASDVRSVSQQAKTGAKIMVVRSNFAGAARVLAAIGLDGCDVLYADLGASSMQIDDPQRGFSFKRDGPLDMRMDDRIRRSAADLVNSLPEAELAAALAELADESDAQAIAAAIVRRRREKPFERTRELAEVVGAAAARSKSGESRLHPAARSFQALRMLVNDELASLRELLRIAPACLRPGGRLAILSFHSGEDRLVKRALRERLSDGTFAETAGEPIVATPEERRENPRSASAKLRWARKPAV